MYGLGTLINGVAIIIGGLIGLVGGKLVADRFREILINVCGISTVFIGAAGALSGLLSVSEDGTISTRNSVMMIITLVLGALVGTAIDLDGKLERFAGWLKIKTGSEKDNGFINAFVTTSLTVCIGAMAIVGAISDALLGDISILVTKSILDFIIVIIMTASLGKGSIFSAIPVVVLQGLVTVLAIFIEPVLTDNAIFCLSTVGSVLITCVGLNLLRDKKISVANLLPSLVFAVLWGIFIK